MVSHVVAFELPMQKIYNTLPPPIGKLDEVLAIMFTGPSVPKANDYTHMKTLLVLWKKVSDALEWLLSNHPDSADLEISYENLKSHLENSPPVGVLYKEMWPNKFAESTSLFNMEEEDGIDAHCWEKEMNTKAWLRPHQYTQNQYKTN